MSSLASLFNVPGTEEENSVWSFAHMASHRDIIRVIYETGGVALAEYSLDPIPVTDMGTWLYQHQQMHNDMNLVLGIRSGLNLTNLEWQDDNARASFVLSNAVEHRMVCNLLGIQ